MSEDFYEKKREQMWENILSLTENYTGELLSDEKITAEDLSTHLSTGFDVLVGVLSEWVAAINFDVMDLNRQEHINFVKSMLEVVQSDMVDSYDELAREDELETLYDKANKIINPEDKSV